MNILPTTDDKLVSLQCEVTRLQIVEKALLDSLNLMAPAVRRYEALKAHLCRSARSEDCEYYGELRLALDDGDGNPEYFASLPFVDAGDVVPESGAKPSPEAALDSLCDLLGKGVRA